ncbi:MAG: DUF2235 domain-containing protein [Planctomycetota bacterium]|nr:DUF2235 domain-containing protein [Planctomycetota bacterium]
MTEDKQGKNIVVFSDGTGQEGGKGSNTNVYKLFNMILDRSPADQIGFYDRGLGTGWRKLTGSIAGMGISKNIQECYKFIFENFDASDRVFLFGFSRGAATVRSLSAFLALFGVLPKSRPELIKQAYKIYKKRNKAKRKRLADEFLARHHTMKVPVQFLGVWDTVAALGVPFRTMDVLLDRIPFWRHKFHSYELNKRVKHGRHALAIDDERRTFHPLLWDEETFPEQTMKQVWFCGMHTDVGGGYKEQGLSDVALQWMIDEATQHGLLIYPDHKVTINPDAHGKMHDSRSGFPGKLFRKEQRFWPKTRGDKPVVHASVIQRAEEASGKHGPYRPWILDRDPDVEGV